MATLIAIAGVVSVLVGWRITFRLFALARRTRGTPERLLAIAFGGLFCVGYPLGAISRAPGLALTNEGSLIFALAMIGMVVGAAALNRFPRVVFRPGQRWAGVVSGLATTAAVVSGLGSASCVAAASTREEMIATIQPFALGLMLSIGIPFLWNAIESWLYYGRMKKRQALGLARPATTHTFLLWALASFTSTAQVLAISAIRASGLPILAPVPMGIIAGCALVASTCWWLAFFMPDAYRVRVLGLEAGAQETSSGD